MASNINPNNINGAYPVAGQDNNSQGFRDNFTNTKTNFQYAAAEITDLENKAVLKSALTGTTLNNDMLGSLLSNAQIQGFSATEVALGTVSGSTSIDYAGGHYQTLTTSGSVSLSFTNFPVAGTEGWVIVRVTIASTAHTLTLPSAVGYGDSAKSVVGIEGMTSNVITFAQTGTYEFQFHTTDGGSTIYLSELTRPRNYFTYGLSVIGNVSFGNTSNVSFGNVTMGNGNVTGDFTVTGNLYATGNIAADKIYNGTTSVQIQTSNGNANITVGGTSNVAVFASTGAYVTGVASVSGNVTGGNISTAGLVTATGNVIGGNITTAGTVKSTSSSAGIGYATGAGNTVTQTGSRTTGVTINAVSGAITLVSAAGNASYNTFTVTNSAVANTDVIIVNQKSGTDKYEAWISNVATGSFAITYADKSSTTTEQPVFNFAVIKAVAA